MILNADSNTYHGVLPTLVVTIEDHTVQVECNDIGFTEEDIVAICNVGASSKVQNTVARGNGGRSNTSFLFTHSYFVCRFPVRLQNR